MRKLKGHFRILNRANERRVRYHYAPKILSAQSVNFSVWIDGLNFPRFTVLARASTFVYSRASRVVVAENRTSGHLGDRFVVKPLMKCFCYQGDGTIYTCQQQRRVKEKLQPTYQLDNMWSNLKCIDFPFSSSLYRLSLNFFLPHHFTISSLYRTTLY